VRFMSPGDRTRRPATLPARGKETTRPPGKWASVPGLSLQPQTPTVCAPVMSTFRSEPADEVTRMRRAARQLLPIGLALGAVCLLDRLNHYGAEKLTSEDEKFIRDLRAADQDDVIEWRSGKQGEIDFLPF